ARRHHQPRGIDLALGRALLAADGGDPAACDGDIAVERRLAGAVDDRAATNNDVVHCRLPGRAAGAAPCYLSPKYCLTAGRETRAVGCNPPLQRTAARETGRLPIGE